MDEDYINFDLLEMFARCGVIKKVDFLNAKYEKLLACVNEDLTFSHKIAPKERNWGPYGGFALEVDWKSKRRKQCDILFRVLVIAHYAAV